jgi:hypothetical protein
MGETPPTSKYRDAHRQAVLTSRGSLSWFAPP